MAGVCICMYSAPCSTERPPQRPIKVRLFEMSAPNADQRLEAIQAKKCPPLIRHSDLKISAPNQHSSGLQVGNTAQMHARRPNQKRAYKGKMVESFSPNPARPSKRAVCEHGCFSGPLRLDLQSLCRGYCISTNSPSVGHSERWA